MRTPTAVLRKCWKRPRQSKDCVCLISCAGEEAGRIYIGPAGFSHAGSGLTIRRNCMKKSWRYRGAVAVFILPALLTFTGLIGYPVL